jgi:uncharacterized protein
MVRLALWLSLIGLLLPLAAAARPLPYQPGPDAPAMLDADVPGPYPVIVQRSRFVPMRDGTRLSTDVYLPVGAGSRLAAVLRRTPYDKSKAKDGRIFRWLASHGFAVLQQDVRGKHESEGVFFPYDRVNATDGYDTLTWIANQSWSNGKVGTIGCSYEGEVQHMLAVLRHPAHAAAIISGDSAWKGDNITSVGFSYGGVPEIAAMLAWNVENAGPALTPPTGIDRAHFFQADWSRAYSIGYTPPAYVARDLLMELPSATLAERIPSPPNAFRRWMTETPGSPYWSRQGGFTDTDRFSVPTLLVSSWYDFTFSPLAAFRLHREHGLTQAAREQTRLIIGPGAHCQLEEQPADMVVGERMIGDGRYDFLRLYRDWFDQFLRGNATPATSLPAVQFYMMGQGRWRSADNWPIQQTRPMQLFLSSSGNARSRFGNGTLTTDLRPDAADSFHYDPAFPTPTRGAAICCTGDMKEPEGAVDVAQIEMRADTLVYTTAPLDTPLDIVGEVSVDLFVSSDAPDTDIVARLTEVDREGRSWVLLDGIQRLRWRNRSTKPQFLTPGKVVRVRFDLEATAIRIAAGNRLRLDIASSGWPRWERNLNTGGDNATETTGKIARNIIHHGGATPSALIIPVVRGTTP